MSNKLVCSAETQHRALKLRIYPSHDQEILINKTFGCCRQIYNNRLFERNEFYENVIKPETDKSKQKELWKTAHFSSEKDMKAKFPYLAEENAEIISLLQSYIDNEWQHGNMFLILSGSSLSFMEDEVLSEKSPIFGRRTGQMKLKVCHYSDSLRFIKPFSNV